MAKSKASYMVGKVTARRAYAKNWLQEINGTWEFKHVVELGHKIKTVIVHPPARVVTVERENKRITINNKRFNVQLKHRSGGQLTFIPAFQIDKAADFNGIFPAFNKKFPEIVNNGNDVDPTVAKPLIIRILITERGGKIFRWERHNIGIKGKKAYRLLLMSINGKDVAHMALTAQQKAAGKIVESTCEIRQALEEKEACRLALGL